MHSKMEEHKMPSCITCSQKKTFKTGHEIKKGMHIMFWRYIPGKITGTRVDNILDYCNEHVNFCSKNIFNIFGMEQRYSIYNHAIVIDVHETHKESAKVRIVDFRSFGPFGLEVKECELRLNIAEDDLKYVKYLQERYSVDEIIDRAQRCINVPDMNSKFGELNAVWCMFGEMVNLQGADDQELFENWIKIVIRGPMPLINYLLEHTLLNTLSNVITVLRFPLLIPKLKSMLEKGLICKKCYDDKFVFQLTSLLNILVPFVSYLLTPLHREIRTFINPLYKIPRVIVRKCRQLAPGDIINIGWNHDVIVKSVTKCQKNSDRFLLDIAHFTFHTSYITRSFGKEQMRFNLKNASDWLQVLRFDGEMVFTDDMVVQNALKLTKKICKFNVVYDRSSYAAFICKIKRDFLKTARYENIDVKHESGVKAGDLVNFGYYGIPQKGVVFAKHLVYGTKIKYFEVKNGKVSLEEKMFDFTENNVFKYNFSLCDGESANRDAVLRFAECHLQKQKHVHNWKVCKSSRFAYDCVFKNSRSD